jgi:hypothetical protein
VCRYILYCAIVYAIGYAIVYAIGYAIVYAIVYAIGYAIVYAELHMAILGKQAWQQRTAELHSVVS